MVAVFDRQLSFLGKIPTSLGPNNKIEWVPVDTLREIIMDLLEQVEGISQDLPMDVGSANGTGNNKSKGIKITATRSPPVYNLVNPSSTDWQSLLPAIRAYYARNPLETVTLREWVDALLSRLSNVDHVDMIPANPAAKLLDFFQALAEWEAESEPSFETTQAARASKTLRDLKPVSPKWMVRWLKQWNFETLVCSKAIDP